MKESAGYYAWALYGNNDANRPAAHIVNSADRGIQGPASLPVNTWSHLAATYDGTVVALYLNGSQVSQLLTSGPMAPTSQPLKIGGNAIWGEWFSGLIDEVRVYSRALSASEIQADMDTADHESGFGGAFCAGVVVGLGWVELGAAELGGCVGQRWGGALQRASGSTSAGFTPSLANRIAQPTGTSYTDTVAAGNYFYRVTAEDAAGNVGAASNEAAATVGDTVAPSAPGTLAAAGAIGQGDPLLGRGQRQRRGCPLQRAPGHERRLHAPAWRTGSRNRPRPATSTTRSRARTSTG